MSRFVSLSAAMVLGVGVMAVGAATTAAHAAPPARAGVAQASAAAPTTLPTTVSQDVLPTVQINGVVLSQVTVGNTVYAVGSFSSARPAGAAAGTSETPRGNILAYDIRTGVLDTSFVHTLNAQVNVVSASPDGSTIYVGGAFTQVDNQTRNRVAAFSTSSGALLPFAPSANSPVSAIEVTSSAVYIGGGFSTVNGNARSRLAAITPAGGLLTWAPSAAGRVRGIVISPDASRIVLGGSFSAVNGQSDYGLAAVDPTTGASLPFAASSKIIASSDNSDGAGIYSLSTDGKQIYGTGYNAIDASFPQFEGTFAATSDGTLNWVNDCWGDSYDAAPINGALYVASHAHNCSAAGDFGESGAHYYALAYDTAAANAYNVPDGRGWNYSAYHTSDLLQWNPKFYAGTVKGQSAWSFTGNSSYVVAGGEFTSIGSAKQQGLARFAVHSLAPNKFGPSDLGPITSSVTGSNTSEQVTVTAAYPAFDPDDASLTYSLIRNGNTASPVATSLAKTPAFWQLYTGGAVTLTDPSAPPGSASTYQIVATDSGGLTTKSAKISVSVPLVDVALGQTATQSSTFNGYGASMAVDGNTNGYVSARSESVTYNDPYSWWQVDLGSTQTVSSIAIWNSQDRPDTIARLSDYYVFASNSPFDTSLTPAQQAQQTGVWSSHQTTAPDQSTTISAGGTKARYVMVQLGTQNQYLNLAEVQVLAAPAQGFVSVSPSTVDEGSVAVGSTATKSFTLANPGSTSVTISNVSLPGAPFTVSPAIKANQVLQPFQSVTESVAYAPTSAGSDIGTLSVTANDGRATQALTLSGMTPGGAVNLALSKPASQSSTPYNGYGANLAVDNNTNGNVNAVSESITGADLWSWWQVDLGSSGRVDNVTVWNSTDRPDTMARLSNYWVFVSNTPFNTSLTPAQQAQQSGVWSTNQTVVPNPSTSITLPRGITGRYVMVQEGTQNQNLNLAEVQVGGPPR